MQEKRKEAEEKTMSNERNGSWGETEEGRGEKSKAGEEGTKIGTENKKARQGQA